MLGQTLGHYRILEQIGAGGMGVVYRAHDERLDRDVALKVLPAGTLADEGARKRFRKEALTLSKLNHPNVETVHDFDTQDGVDFLVMELIPGISLDQKLIAGALPEKYVLRLGQQLAEGLSAAHAEGVIHRDLKPGNLRLTPDGRLKILDFGLAKLFREVAETDITASVTMTQGVAGTLPYMAPEQLRGEPADARSDVWAAGAVLYEMATGRRPFDAKLSTALAGDIQHTLPSAPRQIQPELSLKLEDIILKCLEKDPENRYQSSRELAVDLRRLAAPASTAVAAVAPAAKRSWRLAATVSLGLLAVLIAAVAILNPAGLRDRLLGRTATLPQIKSIAVLPLANLSGDPGQEYFADGMTEALIGDLAKIQALKVISRTSAMHYKGTNKTVPEIARELGVDAVVEGSVARSETRVRITAQLIDARSDQHLWAESYERELHDTLALQSEMARTIADQVRIQVTPQERTRLAGAPAKIDPNVYDLYLKARQLWNQRTKLEDVVQARAYLEDAIERDPTFAPGYASLAELYSSLPAWAPPDLTSAEAYVRTRRAASKALELDPNLAEAHLAMAVVKDEWDWDWEGADQAFRRALELNPSSANGHSWYAAFLSAQGRHEQAIAEARRAVELDPFCLICDVRISRVLYMARRYDDCIEHSQKILDRTTKYGGPYGYLGFCREMKGEYDPAIEAWTKGAILEQEISEQEGARLVAAYKSGGRKAAAQYMLQLGGRRNLSPELLARRYVIVEDYDRALVELEKMVAERRQQAVWLKVNPAWDPLRSNPRFQALLKRMNFPP